MPLIGNISGSGGLGITGSVVFAGADPDISVSFPNIGTDVAFYVSGSHGGKNHTADQGVAVFGGDVVLSGALHIVSSSGHGDSGPANMFVLDDERGAAQIGRAHIGYVGSSDFAAFAHQDNADTVAYALSQRNTGQTDLNTKAGTVMTFRYASAVRMQMNTSGDFSVGPNYAPGTHKLAISGSTLIEDDLFVSGGMTVGFGPTESLDGSDGDFIVNTKESEATFKVDGANDRVIIGSSTAGGGSLEVDDRAIFQVSGNLDGFNNNEGLSVFGGAMMVSGAMVVGFAPTQATDGNETNFIVHSKERSSRLKVVGENGRVVLGADDAQGNEISVGSDTFFYVSGGIDHKNQTDRNTISTFGGDLVVSGNLYLENLSTAAATSIGVTNDDKVVKVSSDRRLKKDFEPVENALSLVNQLQGTYYIPIERDSFPENREIGLISQEVDAVIPELTFTARDGYGGVHYGNAVALLVEAVKELTDEVDRLKSRLSNYGKPT